MALDGIRMLAVVLAIGSGVWVGGLVTVVILAVASRTTVAAVDRVALFRVFGKRFAVFMGVVALFVVPPALVLATVEPTPLTASTLVLALGLLLVTAIGILQARRMSALRRADASGSGDPAGLRRNAAGALALRSLIGLAALALPVLALLVTVG
jgi:hypothetical protein